MEIKLNPEQLNSDIDKNEEFAASEVDHDINREPHIKNSEPITSQENTNDLPNLVIEPIETTKHDQLDLEQNEEEQNHLFEQRVEEAAIKENNLVDSNSAYELTKILNGE